MELTVEDRFAIQELYARYCHTVDQNDAEGWADTFTEDGERYYDPHMPMPARAGKLFKGRRELIGLQTSLQETRRPLRTRHWQSTPVLSDAGDHISAVVYGMVVDVSQEPPVIRAHTTYTDRLVKLEDGNWKIQFRASVHDRYPVPE
jgi:hypothetical protein